MDGVSDGIVKLHFDNVFALENMVSTDVKRDSTMATSAPQDGWKTGQPQFALKGDDKSFLWCAIMRQGSVTSDKRESGVLR